MAVGVLDKCQRQIMDKVLKLFVILGGRFGCTFSHFKPQLFGYF